MADVPEFSEGSLKDDLGEGSIAGLVSSLMGAMPENEFTSTMKAKFASVMEKYKDLSEEDKAAFVKNAKKMMADKMGGVQRAMVVQTWLNTGKVCAVVFVLVALFVFFGYKLYKSITDKESKREEKRKAKQLKKKK